MLTGNTAARAQQEVWLSATGSTARPPARVVGAGTSSYVLLGLEAKSNGPRWDADGSLSFGNGFQSQAGRWLWGDITTARTWSRQNLSARLSTTATGLRYTTPFSYGAYTLDLEPAFTWNATSNASFTVTPQATGGFWTTPGETGGIGVVGSSVGYVQTLGSLTAQLTAEAQHANNGSINGTFTGAGVDVWLSRGALDAGASVKTWHSPHGSEVGYSAFVSRTLQPNLRVDVQLSRSVLDPVLATPGSFGASLALNWRVGHARNRTSAAALYRIGASTAKGRHVLFRLTLPSAQSVAISGTFTDWTPIEMQHKGKTFVLDVVVPPGTHQFGFLVDGATWYLPPNASGVVSDDFGRKNATLVI